MTGLAAAIRLRKRQLDALAMRLAGEQAAANALLHQREDLSRARAAERHLAAAVPLPDGWRLLLASEPSTSGAVAPDTAVWLASEHGP